MKKSFIFNVLLPSFMILAVICIIPRTIDLAIFGNKITSNLNNGEWSSFLGSYIGAIISVFGIFLSIRFQLFVNSEKKLNDVLKTIKSILNLNLKIFEEKKYLFHALSNLTYDQNILKINSQNSKLFYNFPQNFFENHINEITTAKIEREMFNVIDDIATIDIFYDLLAENKTFRNDIIKKKLDDQKSGEHANFVKIIRHLNDVIYYYANICLTSTNIIDETEEKIHTNIGAIQTLWNDYTTTVSPSIFFDLSQILNLNICSISSMNNEEKIEMGLNLGNIYLQAINILFTVSTSTIKHDFFLFYLRETENLNKLSTIENTFNCLLKKECIKNLKN